MKKGKVKVIIFALIGLLSFVGLAFFNMQKFNVSATYDEEVESSFILDKDGQVVDSFVTKGYTKGYDEFLLGRENVELSTRSVEGFNVYGWQITYPKAELNLGDVEYETIILNKTNDYQEIDGYVDVNFKVDFLDNDADGNYETSTLKLSKVFAQVEDDPQIIIEPIFNYTYYKINATSLIDISDFNTDDGFVYYTSNSEEGGVLHYENAFVLMSGEYYYYGDVYSKSENYFTLHDGYEIPLEYGAFRLDERINLVDMQISKCVDVLAFKLGETELTIVSDTLQDDSFKLTKDANTLVSTNYSVSAIIKGNSDLVVDYDNVYKVSFSTTINQDSEPERALDSGYRDELLKGISTENAFSYYNNVYYVKRAEDNLDKAFLFKYLYYYGYKNTNTYVDDGSTNNYYYYKLSTINTQSVYETASNEKSLPNIDCDTQFILDYVDYQYEIRYYFAEKFGEFYQIRTGDVIENAYLTRGSTFNLGSTDVEELENYGYKFNGFAQSLKTTPQINFSLTIDSSKPRSQEMYLCYEKINYAVRLTDTDYSEPNKLVDKNGNVYHGLYSATLQGSETVVFSGNSLTFTTTYTINSTINLTIRANNGFAIDKINSIDVDYQSSNVYNFVLDIDQEFLKNVTGETIIIPINNSVLNNYSVVYTIAVMKNAELEDVIMADISVDTDSTSVVTEEDDSGTITKITISNLKLYDEISLKCTSRKVSISGNEYYQYQYLKNNANEKFAGTTSDNINYSHLISVDGNNTYTLVYSIPKASLYVRTYVKGYANYNYDLISVELSQAGVPLTYDDPWYVLNAVDIVDFKFTYHNSLFELLGCEVINGNGVDLTGYDFESTDPTIAPSTSIQFRPTGNQTQAIVVVLKPIIYQLEIIQHGDASFEDSKVDFDNGLDHAIQICAIDNETYSSLANNKFTYIKPAGYYIDKFYVKNDSQNIYLDGMVESNELRNELNNNLYEYAFNIDEFIALSQYGMKGDDNVVTLTMHVDYLIYRYSVTVSYEVLNDVDDINVVYPDISINVEAERVNNFLTVHFNNIPYGENVELTSNKNVKLGMSTVGWFNGDNLINNEDVLNILNINHDKMYLYKIEYVEYSISAQNSVSDINKIMGDPVVKVNGTLNDKIRFGDSLMLSANSKKSNGYKIKSISYLTPKLYEYNSETWLEDYNKLYYVSKGDYVPATDSYDENLDYYEFVQKTISGNPDLSFVSFNIMEFVPINEEIKFTFTYELIKFVFVDSVSNTGNDYSLNGIGDLNIEPNDYAVFEYYKKVGSNEILLDFNIDDADNKFTVDDSIIIKINLNNVELDGALLNLKDGLILKSITLGNKSIEVLKDANGNYYAKATAKEIIDFVDESNSTIQAKYYFEIQIKKLTVGLNIKTNQLFDSGFKLYIKQDASFAGGVDVTRDNIQNFCVSHEVQFLSKLTADYSLGNNYKNDFRITSFKVWIDGSLRSENLDQLGIVPKYDENGILEEIIVRCAHDVKIEFVLEPIILFDGKEINADYTFEHEFDCDNNGDGILNALTIGKTSSFDLSGADFIISKMKVKYFNNGIETEPINVLRNNYGIKSYEVKISFEGSSGEEWLKELTIPYNVYLKITPKPIEISYNPTTIGNISKTYDGLSTYDAKSVLSKLIVTEHKDSAKRSFAIDNFELNDIFKGFITITSNAGTQERISKANELTKYNLYITNLELKNTTFNNNFELFNSDIVIYNYIQINRKLITIRNLEVYNKVFDDTTKATLKNPQNLVLSGVLNDDNVAINSAEIIAVFLNKTVGANRSVSIDPSNCLIGLNSENYKVDTSILTGVSIYPYSISAEINGVGVVTVRNDVGLTDFNKVSLIPINAKLNAVLVVENDVEYVKIYKNISSYLSRASGFNLGYKLEVDNLGIKTGVNKELTITAPIGNKLNNVIFITSNETGTANYSTDEGLLIIDINDASTDVKYIVLTQEKTYLKAWQIVLICVGGVLLIGGGIVTFVLLRRRKIREYNKNDKI